MLYNVANLNFNKVRSCLQYTEHNSCFIESIKKKPTGVAAK